MWYCNLIVTDVKHQDKGHATFIMNQLTAKVREAGEILGLSTGLEVNVSIAREPRHIMRTFI